MVFLHGVPAVAAEEEPEALIRQGVRTRQAGDDAKAYGYFKRAHELAHTPRSAAQLGLVEVALSDFESGERHLTESLAARDPWIEKNRSVLETTRNSARTHLGRVQLNGLPAGAQIRIDDGLEQVPLDDGVLWLTPGTRHFRAIAPGRHPVDRRITVVKQGTVELLVEMPSDVPLRLNGSPSRSPKLDSLATGVPESRAKDDRRDSGRGLRIAGIFTTATGVALVVAGGLFYRAAWSQVHAIERDARANGGMGVPYDESNGQFQALGTVGLGFLMAGGAAVTTGTVLYLVGASRSHAESGTQLSLSLGRSQRALLIARRF